MNWPGAAAIFEFSVTTAIWPAYSNTAVASISTRALGSNRPLTSTTAMAGNCRVPTAAMDAGRRRGSRRTARTEYSSMSTTYQMKQHTPPLRREPPPDVVQRLVRLRHETLGKFSFSSQPTMPPTKTIAARLDAVGVALRARPAGGCRARRFSCATWQQPDDGSGIDHRFDAFQLVAMRHRSLCAFCLGAAQLEALQLAGLRLRQLGDELDGARIFVGRDRRLDVILQQLVDRRVAGMARAQHHVGLDDLAALRRRARRPRRIRRPRDASSSAASTSGPAML